MKLSILFLFTLATAALRADVVLNDNGTVTRDGVSLNNAGDAVKNGLITSAELNAALQVKLVAAAAAVAASQADTAALNAAMQMCLTNDLSTYQTALQTATNDTQKAVLAAQIALVQSYITQAGMSPDQLRAASLAASIAAQQAELAKLQGN